MKRLALAGLSAVAITGVAAPVFAADLPQPAEPAPYVDNYAPAARFDWSGFYAGANLGWGFGNFDNRNAPDIDANGVTGGIHAGYNIMLNPNVLAGVEADFMFSDMEDSKTVGGNTFKNTSTWNSTVRGRLGYTFDKFMVYGTGGLAIADLETKVNGNKKDTTAVGWTVGAGVEGAITQNVTARIEYDYQDYGSEKYSIGGAGYRTDFDQSLVRAGISYKF